MAAVYGIQGALAPAGFPGLAAATAAAAAPLPPAPVPPPALGPIAFDGTQARIDLIQPPGPRGYPIPGYAMPYANYELLSQHLQFDYSMAASRTATAPGVPAAGDPRGIALSTIKSRLKSVTSPLKTALPVWSSNRIKQFVDDAAPPLPAGAVFDPNVFAAAILADMNTLARQNANRGGAPALAAPIPITRPQIGI